MSGLILTSGYPWVIANAVALVDDVDVFKELPESYCGILRRLIKKVGKTDGQQAIFAKRQTLAEESGKSVETVYRALREFESRGWIQQRERKARAGLIGSDSEITFTQNLCRLLGLPYTGSQVPKGRKSSVTADRSNKEIYSSFKQPIEHPSDLLKKPQTYPQPEEGRVVRIEGKTVPVELAWLVEKQELTLSGLFLLMKTASDRGKRLSDVVACIGKYITNLFGRDLFGYINKILYLDRDFTWEVRQQREKEHAQQKSAEDKERVKTEVTNLHGKWFFSNRTGAIIQVDRGDLLICSIDTSGKESRGVGLVDAGFLDALERGDVVPCKPGRKPEKKC